VYGVSEPLWHQNSHWFAEAGYHSQNEIDMYALNLTINNWAISGWAPYLVVAICMGLAGHRFKLPMTFRSCFYPILQEYTWGWIGDLIDGFTIVVTGMFHARIVLP
jgi:BCCT family betaine/carnitine transporter